VFSPVAMKRLSVIVLERDERAVLRGLGRLGAVHLLRTPAGPDTAPQQPPDRSAQLARCDGLAARIDGLRQRLGIEAEPAPACEPPELSLDQAEQRLAALEARAGEILNRRQAAQQQWGQATALLEHVSAYEGVDVPADRLSQAQFLHFAVGSLPADNLDDLREKVGPNVVLVPLPEKEGKQTLVAVTSRKGRFALETALEGAGFRRDAAPPTSATAVAGETRRQQAHLAEELKGLNDAATALAAEYDRPLAELACLVTIERRILEAEQNFPHTDATVLITGWVPAEDTGALRHHLDEMSGGRCVVEVEDPGDVPEQEIPVLLRHPRLLRPFEMLVAGYGLPAYHELEPTLFVALSYVLMFGMMFGDVGHGAVLALGGALALVFSRAPKVRDVGLLLIFIGLSSVVFGAVYGSYFGIESLKHYALWRDPLEGATPLMYSAVGIGIVIVSLGLVLNIVNRFRRRDWVGGFMDKFGVAGAVFYWGILALFLKSAALREGNLLTALVVLVVVLPMAAVILKEPLQYALSRKAGRTPHAGSLIEALMESAIEAFEAVLGYMSNTISFVRLMAYAMAHAAVLLAAFTMAKEISKVAATFGGALGLLIIIFGNIVAILLEGIIASMQAIRLEWIEFFGKFFSGSGQAFRPFRFPATGQNLSHLK